jgi:Leucine-rich repeat (LRR) protein
LNEKYPSYEKNNIISLNIDAKNLEGELKLEGFGNLEEINCSLNILTDLQIIDSPNLKKINCEYNLLKKLDFRNFPKLEVLVGNNNSLTDLDLSKNKNLRELDMMDNNFSQQDLSIFSHLVNLEKLLLGNWRMYQTKEDFYNRFNGSLKILEKLTKLEKLDIRNTDINSGLEYLSDSVKFFCCSLNIRDNAGVRKIFNSLNDQRKLEFISEEESINGFYIKDFPSRIRNYKETFSKEKGNEKGLGETSDHSDLQKQAESLEKMIKELKESIRRKDEVAIVFQKNKEEEINTLNAKIKQLENQLGQLEQEKLAKIEQPTN